MGVLFFVVALAEFGDATETHVRGPQGLQRIAVCAIPSGCSRHNTPGTWFMRVEGGEFAKVYSAVGILFTHGTLAYHISP